MKELIMKTSPLVTMSFMSSRLSHHLSQAVVPNEFDVFSFHS